MNRAEKTFLTKRTRRLRSRPWGFKIPITLYGVLMRMMQQRATAAMVATTSTFRKPAVDCRAPMEFQMDLKDFDAVKTWIKREKR